MLKFWCSFKGLIIVTQFDTQFSLLQYPTQYANKVYKGRHIFRLVGRPKFGRLKYSKVSYKVWLVQIHCFARKIQ